MFVQLLISARQALNEDEKCPNFIILIIIIIIIYLMEDKIVLKAISS